MPVQIGVTGHSFSNPTGLLSDCHRRIEMFLRSLEAVAAGSDTPLTKEAHTALASALRYFRESAPKHTDDEEESLFPRLRCLPHPDVSSALASLDRLEQDHRKADALHVEVESLGRKCLAVGHLPHDEASRLLNLVRTLASLYAEHIRIEDETIFPLAAQLLAPTEKEAIANEMAARREVRRTPSAS